MSGVAEVSLNVGTLIAQGCRRSPGLPPFARVAHREGAVLVETLDGDFFRISVTQADHAIFPPRSNDDD